MIYCNLFKFITLHCQHLGTADSLFKGVSRCGWTECVKGGADTGIMRTEKLPLTIPTMSGKDAKKREN